MRARVIEPPRQREVMTVFDTVERKTVAKAKYHPNANTWMVRIYGMCWIDGNDWKSPLTGKSLPNYHLSLGRESARDRLQELADQINSA